MATEVINVCTVMFNILIQGERGVINSEELCHVTLIRLRQERGVWLRYRPAVFFSMDLDPVEIESDFYSKVGSESTSSQSATPTKIPRF